jgi:hypothetical protein
VTAELGIKRLRLQQRSLLLGIVFVACRDAKAIRKLLLFPVIALKLCLNVSRYLSLGRPSGRLGEINVCEDHHRHHNYIFEYIMKLLYVE